MSNQNETKDLLRKMAKFSVSVNQINEIHEKNLKMYPFIFFNGVKGVKIDYDISNQSKVQYELDPKKFDIKYKFEKPNIDHFKMDFFLEIDENELNEHLDKRFDALEKSVATLLWNGIPLKVFFNDKLVYETKNEPKPSS